MRCKIPVKALRKSSKQRAQEVGTQPHKLSEGQKGNKVTFRTPADSGQYKD